MSARFTHLSALLLLCAAAAASGSAAEPSSKRQGELLHLMRHDCGSCHGMTLKGGLGPSLLPERIKQFPDEFLVSTVLEGREGTAMPPWKGMLSHDEVVWMVEQLRQGLPNAN